MNPIILIPARMASTRLPNKPLADIEGLPMIVQVMKRAQEANVGRVVIACDGEEIKKVVEAHGGEAVLTDPNLPSGSDRIFSALQQIDPDKKHDIVINVQGDMPTLNPQAIRDALELMKNPEVEIGTLAARIHDDFEYTDSAVVKPVIQFEAGGKTGRAVDFNRNPAEIGSEAYHHVGLYAYRREALEKFVALPPSKNETGRKLEQMRAMDNGMRIDVAIVPSAPLGVDTPETLEKARKSMRDKNREDKLENANIANDSRQHYSAIIEAEKAKKFWMMQ